MKKFNLVLEKMLKYRHVFMWVVGMVMIMGEVMGQQATCKTDCTNADTADPHTYCKLKGHITWDVTLGYCVSTRKFAENNCTDYAAYVIDLLDNGILDGSFENKLPDGLTYQGYCEKLGKITDQTPKGTCYNFSHAINWVDAAKLLGWTVDLDPKIGTNDAVVIMYFDLDKLVSATKPFGHVAPVASINDKGDITVNHYNFGGDYKFSQTVIKKANIGNAKFIHVPKKNANKKDIISTGFGYFPKGSTVTYQEVGGDCNNNPQTCIVGTNCDVKISQDVDEFCDDGYKLSKDKKSWESEKWTNSVKMFGYTANGLGLIKGTEYDLLDYPVLNTCNILNANNNTDYLYLPFNNLTLGQVVVIASRLGGNAQTWAKGEDNKLKEWCKTNTSVYVDSRNLQMPVRRDSAIAIIVRAVNKLKGDIIKNNAEANVPSLFNNIADSKFRIEIEQAMRAGLIRNQIEFKHKSIDFFERYQIAQVAVLIQNLIEGGTNTILFDVQSIEIQSLQRICPPMGPRSEGISFIHLKALAATPIAAGAIAWTCDYGKIEVVNSSEIKWTGEVTSPRQVTITAYNETSVYSFITTVYPNVNTNPVDNIFYASDYPNLQAALDAAKGGILIVPKGVYIGSFTAENVTIQSETCNPADVILDGNFEDDVLHIIGFVKLNGVTIINSRTKGNRAGIVIQGDSNLEMVNVIIKNNFYGVQKNGSGSITGHHVTMEANSEAQFRINGSGKVTLTDVKYVGSSTKVDKNGASGSVSITEGEGAKAGLCLLTIKPLMAVTLTTNTDSLTTGKIKATLKVKANKTVKGTVRLVIKAKTGGGGRVEDEVITLSNLSFVLGKEQELTFENKAIKLSSGNYTLSFEFLETGSTTYQNLLDKDVVVPVILATEEEQFSQSLLIFPNPSNDYFTLKIDIPTEYLIFNVRNMLGQQIDFSKTIIDNQTMQINLNNVAVGFYTLEITKKQANGKSITIHKKLMKQ